MGYVIETNRDDLVVWLVQPTLGDVAGLVQLVDLDLLTMAEERCDALSLLRERLRVVGGVDGFRCVLAEPVAHKVSWDSRLPFGFLGHGGRTRRQ